MIDFIFLGAGLLLLLGFIKSHMKSEAPVKHAVKSMLTGVIALSAASLIAGAFKAHIAVNIYTVFIAITLGLPGVGLITAKTFII